MPAVRKSATAVRAPAKPASAVVERPHQQDVVNRLRRVEGQIRGVLAMIDDNEPCDAIAQQLAAARKALDRAFYEMLACSLEMELSEASDREVLCQRIAEKTRLLAKYA